MNRIYRVIRSRTYHRDVVVSEITKTTGKSKSDVRTAVRSSFGLKSWLLGLATATLMASPLAATASEITGLDGKSLITATDKTHNLYAQQINFSNATGKVGVSKYGKFHVTSGDVANLHFNQKGGTVYADSLVNLVNNKINIEGTVNALKENRIGGHLYFLSPQGMAVSSSGVINAGQFTAIVPTTKLFNALRDGSADSFNEHFYDYVMEKGQIKDLSDWYSTENNENIEIKGKVNTRSGIKLRASKIDITQGAKLLSNREIDFNSLVNTTDFGGVSNVGMTAVADDKTGDIVLKAGVETYADDVLIPETMWPGVKVTTRQAFINVDGALESDGAVEIGAVAKSTFREGSVFNLLGETDLVNKILGDLGVNLMADYASKTNTSHISLGKTGSITSGGKTDISAANTVAIKLSAATPAKKTGSSPSEALPVIGVGVVKQVNNAQVDVYGDITSGADLALKASADTSVDMKVKSATAIKSDPQAPDPNLIYISLGVIASDTDAAVNIHAGGNKVTATGPVTISAATKDVKSLEVESSAPDKTFASTAFGIIDSDADASVIIDRSIDAKGSDQRKDKSTPWVNISASYFGDNVTTGTVSVTNTLGGINYEAPFKPEWQESAGIVDSWLDPLVAWGHGKAGTLLQKIKIKLGRGAGAAAGGAGGDVVSNLLTNLGSTLKAGASVAVDTQDNTTQIKVGDGVTIDAGGANDISLKAGLDTEGLNVVAEGVGNNQGKDQKTKVMVAVGVQGSSVENTALISLGKNAKLTGKKVAVVADADMAYNPVVNAALLVASTWTSVWEEAQKTGKDLSSIKEIGDKLDALKQVDDPTKLPGTLTDISTMGSNRMEAFLDSIKDMGDTYRKIQKGWKETLALLDPATYTNYYARAEVSNTKKGSDSTKLDAAAAINIDVLHNQAVVAMAEKAAIEASDDAKVHAGTKTQTVALTGTGGKYLQSDESGKSGVGISLAVQDITGDGVVLMGKEAAITSAKNLTVESDNMMRQYGVLYGAGEAGTLGLTGMINVMTGDSNSLVSLDDETRLSAAKDIHIDAKNDSQVLGIAGGATLGDDSSYASIGFGLTVTHFDANTEAVIADNAKDATQNWLSDAELAQAKSQAQDYSDGCHDQVAQAVDEDIATQVIDPKDRDAEITRRLQVLYDTKLDEVEKDLLAHKTYADKELNANVLKADAVNLARKVAQSVAVHTYDGKEDPAKASTVDVTASLGDATKQGDSGSIKANNFSLTATNTGTINNIAIEGTYSASEHGAYDAYNKALKRSEASSFMSDFVPNLVGVPIDFVNRKLGGKITNKLNPGAAAGAAGGAVGGGGAAQPIQANGVGVHVAAAGSLAVNVSEGKTLALADNTDIAAPDKGALKAVTVKADDSLFSGAWAGGAAINAHSGQAGGSKEVSAGMALALNLDDRNVGAIISHTKVGQAESIDNEAAKSGADVGLGIGLAVSKGGAGGKEASASASVSYNQLKTGIYALMVNDTVTGSNTALTNRAFNQDIQVAGGVDFSWTSSGDDGFAFGGTAAASKITDILQSGIYGGTYTGMGDMTVDLAKASLQVNAAVAGAVSTEESAKDAAFAVAVGVVDNESEASIEKATITSGKTVRVEANDTANKSSYQDYLKKRGTDPEGTSYLGDKGKDLIDETKGGSKTVNVAIGFDKSGKGGGSVAGSVNDLTENMAAKITDATITAQIVQGQADSKTTVVDVAAGVAVAGEKFNGAGSFSWNDLTAKNTALLANNTLHAGTVNAIANNDATIVGVAGEVGLGKGTAVGLAFAYNSLDSTTNALLQGGTAQSMDGNGTLAVNMDAQNTSDITAVAFGAQISTEKTAWNGTLAINMGNNDTEAAIEKYKGKDPKTGKDTETGAVLSDVGAITVNTVDKSTRRTGAGELTFSKGAAAVGVAVGYGEIGGTSADAENPDEILRSEIKGATITTKKVGTDNPTIKVTETDGFSLQTAGVGIGIGAGGDNKLNAQGAAAGAVIAKKSTAALTDTTIDTDSKGQPIGTHLADVSVTSTADNDIGTGGVAAVGSFGKTVVSAGVGLAINKIGNQSSAQVTGSTMNVGNLLVQSDSASKDLGVAAGFAGSAGDVAAAGSFSYNYINSHTAATVKDSTVTSEGNIGVVAKSDEVIDNYAGAIEGSKSAAIGASVAVNRINGHTDATVSGSSLTAKGATSDTVTLYSDVKDGDIISQQASKDTFDASRLKKARQKAQKTGIVVDSSATHAIASDLVSGGGAGKVAVELTFNENYVSGQTTATVTETGLNSQSVKTVGDDKAVPDVGAKQDVRIAASDYTNIGTFEVGLAGSENVSVGATQNANVADRTVTAKLAGKDAGHLAKVNAHDLDVLAVSKQGLSNLGIAGAGAGMGVSAAANILTDKIDMTTQSSVKYADIGFTDKVAVTADNLSRAYIGTYDAAFTLKGAALGTGIGVISETSKKVLADITHATVSDHQTEAGSSQVTVGASNTVETGSYFASAVIAGLGGTASGTFTHNGFEAEVGTTLDHATVHADTVGVSAKEDLYAENYGADITGSAFVSVGINSTNNAVHDKVYTKVADSTVTATEKLAIGSETRRDLRQLVVNFAGSIAAVGVNVQNTSVNQAITDDKVKDKIKEANTLDTDMTGYFAGMSQSEKAQVRQETALNLTAGEAAADLTGVHTFVSNSTLKADGTAGTVTVDATERNRINSQAGGAGVGAGLAVVTTLSEAEVHHDTGVAIEGGTVSGHDIKVTSFIGDNKKHVDGYQKAIDEGKTEEEVKDSNPGLFAMTGVGNVGVGAVTPAIAQVTKQGTSGVSLKDTAVTGTTVALAAADAQTKEANVTAVTVGIAAIEVAHASVDDLSATTVGLDYTKGATIKADESLNVDAQKRDDVKAKAYGVGVSGVGFNGTWAFADDHSTAAVTVTGSGLTVDAPTALFSANNAPALTYSVDNHGGTIVGGFFSKGRADAQSEAIVNIASGNRFDVDDLTFRALVGEKDRTMASGELWSVSVSGVNFTPDIGETQTKTKAMVAVGDENYKTDGNGTATTALTVAASSEVTHANWAKMMDISALDFAHFGADGALQAESTATDTVSAAAAGGTVASLDLSAHGNVSVDNYASGNGGAAVGLGVASRAVNSFETNATAALGGTWQAGSVKAGATQSDTLLSEAYSGHGGAIDVTWVEAENTMKGKSQTKVEDKAQIVADTVEMSAQNQLSTNQGGKYENRVHGVVGAVAAGTVQTSDDTVEKTADITIGKNVSVATTGQQRYGASTQSAMDNNVLAFAAGLFEGGTARGYTTHTYNNAVTLEEGATLKNTGTYAAGGITLSATENLSERVDADVHIAGVIGVAPNSKAQNYTTRNDTVTVKGTIDSTRDINLYAGADVNGGEASLRHETVSEAYNESVIPIAWPTDPDAKIIGGNKVAVTGTGTAKAIRNINVVADSGSEDGYIESRSACLYTKTQSDKTMLTVKDGQANYNRTTDNAFQVAEGGLVQAGVKSKIFVSVDGVMVPEGTIKGQGTAGSYTVSIVDGENQHLTDLEGQVTVGHMDYANVLADQWYKLNELLEAYEGKDLDQQQLTAYSGYLLEKQALEDQMERLHLLTTVEGRHGKVKVPVLVGYQIAYVEMPPELAASGGNVMVHSDNFYGKGGVKADGHPAISVQNTSNAYLVLNQMTIGDEGGGIVFNDVTLPDGKSGVDKVNTLNKNKDYKAEFNPFITGKAGDSGITVANDNVHGADTPVVTQDDKGQTVEGTYTALSNVEVAGVIQGNKSSVAIDNKSGSIIVDSGTADKPVSINGKEIVLTAADDITQGFTDGMVNIGYTPEAVLADVEKSEKGNTETYTGSHKENIHEECTETEGEIKPILDAAESGGRIAGGSVYLAATSININGLIQSGFGAYAATVTEDALLGAIQASQTHTGGVMVDGRQMYKVNDGGMKKGTDGTYTYEVQVYYDPSTSGLVAEDIDTKGGKVYLSGRILSTGKGRLYAADGGAAIAIDNQSSAPLTMGRILNNQIDGIIQITDTQKNTRVTYARSGTTTVTDYKAWLKAGTDAERAKYVEEGGASDVYQPQANLRYNWSDGTQSTTKTTYQTDTTKFLGLIKTDDDISKYETSEYQHGDPVTTQGDPLPQGGYLTVGQAGDSAYTLVADNRVDNTQRSSVDSWTEWHFLNKHYYSKWTVTTGATQTYANGLKADYPITVGFLGQENGSIAVSSTKDVTMGGNVRNNNAAATFDVQVSDGRIAQQAGTTAFVNQANLKAKGAIENIVIDGLVDDQPVKLDMVSQNGALSATVTGAVALANFAAGVGDALAADTYGSQNATLTATGNITQDGADTAFGVKGAQISLTSSQGSVGTADVPLKVQVAQHAEGDNPLSASINASAQNDIHLLQATGDMRVGTLAAATGDVSLTATEGTFIDATPYKGTANNVDTDALIQRWIDNGLIAGEGDYTRKLAQAVDHYKADTEQAFAQYQALKAWFDTKPDVPADPESIAYKEYQQRKALYDQQVAKFGAYSDVAAYLASDTQYQALVDKRDHPTYKWTQEQMLYAVRDSIVNKDSGSTDQEKKNANITGKDITLKGMGVGIDKATKEVITVEMLDNGYVDPDTGLTYVDYLKKLANADAADVDVEYEKDAKGNTIRQQIPVYKVDAQGKAVLDKDGNPIVDHYKEGDPVIDRFIIGGKSALGIYATGIVNAESLGADASHEGDIYLASRNKSEKELAIALNINQVTVKDQAADVRLYGKAGVFNALENTGEGEANENTANVVAKNLIVEGGTGTIGAIDEKKQVKHFTVDLAGTLTARADGSVYIRNVNDNLLQLDAIRSADSVYLVSDKGMVMGDADADIAYINAKEGLSLTVNPDTGILGTADHPLRILNNGVVIEVAAKTANLHGVTGGDSDTMKLGLIQTKDTFTATSEDSIDLLASYEKQVIKTDDDGAVIVDRDNNPVTEPVTVNGALTAGGDTVLMADDNLTLDAPTKVGAVDEAGYVTDGRSLLLSAETGSITQTKNGAVTAGALQAVSSQAMAFTHTGNHFGRFTASGIQPEGAAAPEDINGSVTVKTHGGQTLHVAFDSTVNSDVAITNLDKNGSLTLGTGITAHSSDTAKGTVSLTADGDLATTAGKVIASDGDTNLTSVSGSVTVDGGVQSGKDLNINAGKDIALDGREDLAGSLNMTAGGAVTEGNGAAVVANAVNAAVGKGLDLQQSGNRFGTITVTGDGLIDGDVLIQAYGTLDGTPDLQVAIGPTVQGNVAVTNLSDAGHLRLASPMTTQKGGTAAGDITLTSDADLATSAGAALRAGGDIHLVSRSGSVLLEGGVSAAEDLVTQAAEDVVIDSALTVPGTFLATATGKVYETGQGSLKAEGVATTTGGAVDLQSGNNQFARFTAQGFTDKPIDGDIRVTDNAKALEARIDAVVDGDVALTNIGAAGRLDLLGRTVVNASPEKGTDGRMTLVSVGDITTDNTVKAASDILFESTSGNITLGNDTGDATESTDGSIVAKTGTGNITINGRIFAQDNGNVEAHVAGDGGIVFNGDVDASHDVLATVGGVGNITFGGDVDAINVVEAKAASGDITFDGHQTGGALIQAEAENGNLTVSGNVLSTKGDIRFKARDENSPLSDAKGNMLFTAGSTLTSAAAIELVSINGNILMVGSGLESDANILADSDIRIDAEKSGNIEINGKLESTRGSIGFKTADGDILTNGDIDAGQDVRAQVIAENQSDMYHRIVLNGTVDAGEMVFLEMGDKDSQTYGDITVLGSIQAGMAESDAEGYIEAGILGSGNITFAGGAIDARTDITAVISGSGNIHVTEGTVHAHDGDVLAEIRGDGNIHFAQDVKGGQGVSASVQGTGDITIEGNVEGYTGNVSMDTADGDVILANNVTAGQTVSIQVGEGNVSVGKKDSTSGHVNGAAVDISVGKGDVTIVRTVTTKDTQYAGDGGVNIETGEGTIHIGNNGPDVETVTAKGDGNIHLASGLGNVEIYGKTSTARGDISVSAVSAGYLSGLKGRNIIIEEEGKIVSGRDATLDATNGDIHVTDDITAKRNLNVATHGLGSVYFDQEVSVGGDVTGSTDIGSVTVGDNINAEGRVALTVGDGNITVGTDTNPDAGHLKAASVTMTAGKGDVTITRTLTSQDTAVAKDGGITVKTGEGTIHVGNNGPDVETVTAKGDGSISLVSDLGKVEIFGKTSTAKGDIAISAASSDYTPGPDGMNIIIDEEGKIVSGRSVSLDAENGDIHVTDDIIAKRDLNATTHKQGSVYFDREVTVDGNVTGTTDKGSITIGKDIAAQGAVAMAVGEGDITVGAENDPDAGHVTAASVKMTAGKGNVTIVKTVSSKDTDVATDGGIAIRTGEGTIHIGNNGPDVQTVSALGDGSISLVSDLGRVEIFGKTSTAKGDIAISAASASYKPGPDGMNIILDEEGEINSGASVRLDAENGDIHVTDDIIARKNLTAATHKEGSVLFDREVSVDGNVTGTTDTGSITIGKNIAAQGAVVLTVGEGDITVGTEKDSDAGHVTAASVKMTAGKGDVTIVRTVTSQDTAVAQDGGIAIKTGEGTIHIGNNGPTVQTVTALGDGSISLASDLGRVEIFGKTSTAKGDIAISAASAAYTPGPDGMNIIIDEEGEIDSGHNVSLDATNGDIEVTYAIKAKQDLRAVTHKEGSVLIDREIAVAGDVAAKTDTGNVTVGKTIEAGGSVDIAVGSGNVTLGDAVTAGENATITTRLGTVKADGDITAEEGDISITAKSASYTEGQQNIQVAGVLDAGRDLVLDSTDGDILLNEDSKVGRNLSAATHENGSVTFAGDTQASGNITVATDQGDITFKGMVYAGEDLMATTAEAGSIVAEDDLFAMNDLTLTATNGTIDLKRVTSGNDMVITGVGEGDIQADQVTALGNATLTQKGQGNITVTEVRSAGTTTLQTTNGDIMADTLSGNRVVALGGNNTVATHIGTVMANAYGGATGEPDVVLGGRYVNVDTVQKDDGNEPLTLRFEGPSEDQPVKGLTVKSLNSPTGSVIQAVWVEDGTIHVGEGDLHISKAYAVDKLHVDNDKVSVALFGATPRREGETIALWNDRRKHQPDNNLDAWYDGAYTAKHWVNMDLAQNGHVRVRNAGVVDDHDYRHFNGDHNSVVNEMGRYLTGAMFSDWYDIVFFDRYGIVDSGDGFEKNATFEELTVE